MKPLKESIFKESIFDDVEDIANNDTILIEQFLEDNYEIRGTYVIKNGVVDVKGYITVKNENIKSFTNDIFTFGVVTRGFYCYNCFNLKSLEGAPKEVNGDFYCVNCSKLTSLEGAPEEVKGIFNCSECSNLVSLKGAPKKVGWDFRSTGCPKLTSLEGAPGEVGGEFYCGDCPRLKTLKGAPEKIWGYLRCKTCKNLKITDQDRKKYKISY